MMNASQFEVCGAAMTTQRGGSGTLPSTFQPVTRKRSFASSCMKVLTPNGVGLGIGSV
jgi:hypothetical protein